MTPEQIVRALAAADPVVIVPGAPWGFECGLCGARTGGHTPDCPWRLAVEWVAGEEARCAGRQYTAGGEPSDGECICGVAPDPGIKPDGGCWCGVDDARP